MRTIFSRFPSRGSMRLSWTHLFTVVLAGSSCVNAIDLTVTDENSIKKVASQMAFDMMSTYTGNRTGDVPGNLPAPYFWWECGGMFGAMVDYWFYTNDSTYNDVTTQALLHQVGPQNNYMPPNQTSTLGNDDQAFWGMTVMAAAEYNFPNPPADQPQWLALAQGVFNSQVPRWDKATCGGGLRWQIFPFNTGFDYKNSISNGANFNLASRLARFTNNQSYADWAEQTFDWMIDVKLIDPNTYAIFDGAHVENNCSTNTNLQWTYNVGIMLHGAANMYNFTNGSAKWQQRVEGLLKATGTFFPPASGAVMAEVACEGGGNCDTDQLSFKAYLSRWLAATSVLAPFTASTIQPMLAKSAAAAAKQCTGGNSGTICGTKWTTGTWDGTTGVGQQMSALEVVQTNLAFIAPNTSSPSNGAGGGGSGLGSATGGGTGKGPLTQTTGGTSQGNASAGTTPQTWQGGTLPGPVTAADQAGASFLTILLISLICGGSFWINHE